MFSVIFEVLPNKENWDDYFDNAEMLRPELEQVEGFVDNIRYRSLTREGWILSLSNWRDEKSLVRWRARRRHHELQQKGRDEIEGNLFDGERAQLMQAANMCPVGRTLGLSADIRTNDNVNVGQAASYDDLSELPIPNINPD